MPGMRAGTKGAYRDHGHPDPRACGHCPACGERWSTTELHCRRCHLTLDSAQAFEAHRCELQR